MGKAQKDSQICLILPEWGLTTNFRMFSTVEKIFSVRIAVSAPKGCILCSWRVLNITDPALSSLYQMDSRDFFQPELFPDMGQYSATIGHWHTFRNKRYEVKLKEQKNLFPFSANPTLLSILGQSISHKSLATSDLTTIFGITKLHSVM